MNLLVIPIIFVAMLVQSVAGFGAALVSMPFLLIVLGADVALPTFILVGYSSRLVLIYQYRHDWQFSDIKLVTLGTLLGIPAGIWLGHILHEDAFMLVLGIILIVYSLYALSGFTFGTMKERWGTLFGLFSGLLHGAYNVGGPPLVMYNNTQDWQARRFKGNLHVVFLVMGFVIIAEHVIAGNLTIVVWQNYAVMIPTMFVALYVGSWLEQYINQEIFRKMVLILLLLIGLNLVNPF